MWRSLLSSRVAVIRALPPSSLFCRSFSAYECQQLKDSDLVKKSDDWVIEETNFCLGRKSTQRFKETDDLAYRVLHLMEGQLGGMHTRLRDGTCIPVMALDANAVLDKPTPYHVFLEQGLVKWTWDETYDEAYEDYDELAAEEKKAMEV
eukprot:GHVS01079980.1.p1 GENE.GHVS01079980.1~~GHVS01079980.1.p1  ORF type:complete len:149 (+),score=25.26 GHVS01079980.1:61-507(+)